MPSSRTGAAAARLVQEERDHLVVDLDADDRALLKLEKLEVLNLRRWATLPLSSAPQALPSRPPREVFVLSAYRTLGSSFSLETQ
jgi:hypothetical protein